MKLYIINENKNINSSGEYNPDTNEMIVLKNSIVSEDVNHCPTFRGAKSVEKYRNEFTSNNKVKEDVYFKSPSTAANFVTGRSTNGFDAWKDKFGKSLKEFVKR